MQLSGHLSSPCFAGPALFTDFISHGLVCVHAPLTPQNLACAARLPVHLWVIFNFNSAVIASNQTPSFTPSISCFFAHCCQQTSFVCLVGVFKESSGYVSVVLCVRPSLSLKTFQLGTAIPTSSISQKTAPSNPCDWYQQCCFPYLPSPRFSHIIVPSASFLPHWPIAYAAPLSVMVPWLWISHTLPDTTHVRDFPSACSQFGLPEAFCVRYVADFLCAILQ